jgi:hypothetical protein
LGKSTTEERSRSVPMQSFVLLWWGSGDDVDWCDQIRGRYWSPSLNG